MKTKSILLILMAVLVFGACKNETEDYKKAMASDDIAVLNSYIYNFADKAPAEHVDSVTMRLDELLRQLEEEILVEQYEMNYGIYIANFENRCYKRNNRTVVFMSPDYYGKGVGCILYNKYNPGEAMWIFTYEINNEGILDLNFGRRDLIKFLATDSFSFTERINDDYSYYIDYWSSIFRNPKVSVDVNYSHDINWFDNNGTHYYEQQMYEEYRYEEVKKMIEACLPTFKELSE